MAEVDRLIEKLRAEWHKATEKNKPQDALKALIELERLDPKEPAWSQRLGEAYRRTSQKKEAVDAFVRAYERYLARGFLPRAIAMAKLVATMDQARGDLLENTLPQSGGPVLASIAPPPQAPTAAPPPLPLGIGAGLAGTRPPPLPLSPVKPAPLTRAPDAADDEVRFSDAGDASISVLLTDFSSIDQVALPRDPSEPPAVSAPAMSVSEVTELDAYATMATFRLFASLSRDALVALADAADLVEFVPEAAVIVKNEKAFALYAIVSGSVRVTVLDNPEIRLGEGEIFGEGSLLEEGLRQADVKAETQLMTLRIERAKLEEVTKQFPEVEHALFDLLARRLVTEFDAYVTDFRGFRQPSEARARAAIRGATRGDRHRDHGAKSTRGRPLHLARRHGDGRARGRRHDAHRAQAPRFGHSGLMGGKSDVTVKAVSEAVLLRMPASQFGALAAQYPPVLAYLAETANEPLPVSIR